MAEGKGSYDKELTRPKSENFSSNEVECSEEIIKN